MPYSLQTLVYFCLAAMFLAVASIWFLRKIYSVLYEWEDTYDRPHFLEPLSKEKKKPSLNYVVIRQTQASASGSMETRPGGRDATG